MALGDSRVTVEYGHGTASRPCLVTFRLDDQGQLEGSYDAGATWDLRAPSADPEHRAIIDALREVLHQYDGAGSLAPLELGRGNAEAIAAALYIGDRVQVCNRKRRQDGTVVPAYFATVVDVKPSGTVIVDHETETDGAGTPLRFYVTNGTITRTPARRPLELEPAGV